MLIITVQVNARASQAIGIKEDLAMFLERYGDARVMTIGGGAYHEQQKKRVSRVRR